MASPVSVTVTMTQTVTAATASSTVRATPQGGVVDHLNPSVYDPKNPITTFIIQAGIIIIVCRLLHFPLAKLRQPRVIAEVLAGIVLGPSVCGHIPGFTNAIFPVAGMPSLNLAANIGLILYLFLVGLEVDVRFLVSNWRIALGVSAAGMILPFGLGAAIAYGLYNQFHDEPGTVPISFGVYLLFIGVAMAITAFPVLCRILTELKLLGTPVGVIVLSAGVGNDVVGWVLLALCVALVNAGSGLAALYVIIICVSYTLFLVYVVRPCFLWVLRRTGSIQNGPSQSVVALTVLMVLTSAFLTGIFGVHPMFGGFMIGLLCPHEGGFAIKMTEKLEDLVCVLFLPLYFALSGLSTNLGLLNSGITWAYVIGVISIAFTAKITGGTLAARATGMVWRESFTIGVLMSCKGLVELIVLNIGLQAKILSTRTFTIFVVMALVTTFATTPIVRSLYPHWYQVKLEAWKRGEIDWEGKKLNRDEDSSQTDTVHEKTKDAQVHRLLAFLRLDSMSGTLALVSLLAKPAPVSAATSHPATKTNLDDPVVDASTSERPLQVHGVRLVELSERNSSVMKVSEIDEYSERDPVVNTFRSLGQFKNLAISGEMMVAPESSFALTLAHRASDISADLLLLPWSGTGAMSENHSSMSEGTTERFASGAFSQFVADTLNRATCNTALFVDNGFGSRKQQKERPTLARTVSALSMRSRELRTPFSAFAANRGHHIFSAYFGSGDDKAAVRLVLQLAHNPTITATIVHFDLPDSFYTNLPTSPAPELGNRSPVSKRAPAAPPLFSEPPSLAASFFASIRESLPAALASRVVFETIHSTSPLQDVVAKAKTEVGIMPKNAGDLIVLGRNAALATALSGSSSTDAISASPFEAHKSLGAVGMAAVQAGINASLLVIHAVINSED